IGKLYSKCDLANSGCAFLLDGPANRLSLLSSNNQGASSSAVDKLRAMPQMTTFSPRCARCSYENSKLHSGLRQPITDCVPARPKVPRSAGPCLGFLDRFSDLHESQLRAAIVGLLPRWRPA